MSAADIQRLPQSTQLSLRSSQILTSLAQVVSELVQNSLDANARHIEVGLDCEDWGCWVRDNGHGISRDELSTLGVDRYRAWCTIMCSRRHTVFETYVCLHAAESSKDYEPDSLSLRSGFGFRGEGWHRI